MSLDIQNTGLKANDAFTPLLVQLYDGQKLYKLAKDKNPDARKKLTSALTELLSLKLSDREKDLISEVLIGLMRQAEKDLRQIIAENVAVEENLPLRVALEIANDEPDVACSVLEKSTVLSDLDLVYIIKLHGPYHWRAIAKRTEMGDVVLNTLAETHDVDTAFALLENKNIRLTEYVMSVMSDIAREHEPLAAPLLRREEITSELASALYEYVGEELKTYITKKFAIDSEVTDTIVDNAVRDLSQEARKTNELELPDEEHMSSARAIKKAGKLNIEMMINTIKRGQRHLFIALMAEYTGHSVESIVSILKQSNGQLLAMICKAYDISKPDFISIFLLTGRIRGESGMIDIKDINRATEYYNRVTQEVAEKILSGQL